MKQPTRKRTMSPEAMLGVAGSIILLQFGVLGWVIKWIVMQLTKELAATRTAMHDLRESVGMWKLDVVDRMARIEEARRIEERRVASISR